MSEWLRGDNICEGNRFTLRPAEPATGVRFPYSPPRVCWKSLGDENQPCKIVMAFARTEVRYSANKLSHPRSVGLDEKLADSFGADDFGSDFMLVLGDFLKNDMKRSANLPW